MKRRSHFSTDEEAANDLIEAEKKINIACDLYTKHPTDKREKLEAMLTKVSCIIQWIVVMQQPNRLREAWDVLRAIEIENKQFFISKLKRKLGSIPSEIF